MRRPELRSDRCLALLALLTLATLLAACAPRQSQLVPTAAPTLAPTAAPAIATSAPRPTVAPTPKPAAAAPSPTSQPGTPTPSPALASELSARLSAELTPVAGASSQPGSPRIEGVGALPLGMSKTGQALYAAFTYGLHSFQPLQRHFVAIYSHDAAGWKELSRVELEADYVDRQSVTSPSIEPSRIWLLVQGGVGAHGGSMQLLSFDGQQLKVELTHSTASPGADSVKDVDGDGRLEVVLDDSDYYVFCYACGVRLTSFSLMRWDGTRLVETKLAPVPPGTSAEIREPASRARDLAEAGLWKDALQTVDQAPAPKPTDQAAYWNAALIRLNAGARADQAKNGPYPLLGDVFYGDYEAALNVMRPYGPAGIFRHDTPLVVGTVAEANREEVAKRLDEITRLANRAKPDLAAGYFLRGWAGYLSRPNSRDWVPDIELAAKLAPNEALYSQSLAFLKSAPAAPASPTAGPQAGLPNPASAATPPAGTRISFGSGSTGASVAGRLGANEAKNYVLRAAANQQMSVEATSTGGVVKLSVSGADGQPLTPASSTATSWRGRLPTSQDYYIKVSGAAAQVDYTLAVTVTP